MNEEIKKALAGVGGLSQLQKITEDLRRQMAVVPRLNIPDIPMYVPPTHQEVHAYQSAGALMKALADAALGWKNQLPQDLQPVIVAILQGGIRIQVQYLTQVSFHGIRIDGFIDGAQCSLLAHQATVQILCFAETMEAPRMPIGFIWGDNNVQV